MRHSGSRDDLRPGFGLVEIVILLAVASVLVALTAPALIQANRLERARETAEILERTRIGLQRFRTRVGANPGAISELVINISTTGTNSCGNGFSGGQRNNWDDEGPYGGFHIEPTVGLVTPIGIADNALFRAPANGGAGVLVIVLQNVDIEDALALDVILDDGDGLAAGLWQWQAPVNEETTAGYLWAIDARC